MVYLRTAANRLAVSVLGRYLPMLALPFPGLFREECAEVAQQYGRPH
jgi:hypothetical protein